MGVAHWTEVRLGKQAPLIDNRTLRLAKYLTPELPAPPASVDWTKGQTDFGMMLNNSLGDCTCAAVGHAIQIFSLNTTGEITLADSTILSCYENWCGYNPTNPSTDQGGVEIEVLNNWRKSPVEGHQLLAYADPDPGNLTHVKQAIQLFGGVYIGVGLPITAQNQIGKLWDVVGDPTKDANSFPNSWGGHAVFVCGYDENTLTCITWGSLQKMTNAWWSTYCDEAHALLSDLWLAGGSPSGFDHDQLLADLEVVAA